ncbi:MAG: 5'/3'-nucleotidase SurE, partial [Clostridia bacterium]
MKILLTNDDGINSIGIKILAEKLCKNHTVYVFAPSDQKSACSQSLTVHSTFGYKQIQWTGIEKTISVEGTPSDCVKLATKHFSLQPDLVISGPNEGSNLGTDILYSGTVAGAMEGAICGFKSIAISQCGRLRNPSKLIDYIYDNLDELYKYNFEDSILNINYPDCENSEIQGIKITKMGKTNYSDRYEHFQIEGKSTYKLVGRILQHDDSAE